MTGNNIAKIKPTPLRPIIDVQAKEVVPVISERERAIEAYVDRLMRRSPALDRARIKERVKSDLLSLADGRLDDFALQLLRYKWTVVNGQFQVDWRDDRY